MSPQTTPPPLQIRKTSRQKKSLGRCEISGKLFRKFLSNICVALVNLLWFLDSSLCQAFMCVCVWGVSLCLYIPQPTPHPHHFAQPPDVGCEFYEFSCAFKRGWGESQENASMWKNSLTTPDHLDHRDGVGGYVMCMAKVSLFQAWVTSLERI